MSINKHIISTFVLLGLLVLASAQGIDLKDITDNTKPKGLDISGAAVSSGATQVQQQIENLKKQKEAVSAQFRQLQYVPIDGEIDGDTYIVGPHDIVHLQVWSATTIDEFVEITPDGMVVLSGYGAIHIGGETWNTAKGKIEAAIKKSYNPQRWAITLSGVRIFWAHVSGAVKLPGSYQVGATQRVWDVIQLAGGTTPLGDLSNIEIIRKNGDTVFANISKYLSAGNLAANPYLEDGDVVVVPPVDGKNGLIRLYSAGVRSGFYGLMPGETVRKFAQRIGIFTQSPELSDVQVIHDNEIKNVNLISEDYPLSTGDIVIFPTHLDSIIVGGIVLQGGAYPYYPGVSYYAYIAMAGGPSDKGSESRVSIYRKGKKLSPKKAGELMPGDVIIVHHSTFNRTKDLIETVARVMSSSLTVYYLIDRLTK